MRQCQRHTAELSRHTSELHLFDLFVQENRIQREDRAVGALFDIAVPDASMHAKKRPVLRLSDQWRSQCLVAPAKCCWMSGQRSRRVQAERAPTGALERRQRRRRREQVLPGLPERSVTYATGIDPMKVVGATGFEPATPRSRTECSTRLSHAPTKKSVYRTSAGVTSGRLSTNPRAACAVMSG